MRPDAFQSFSNTPPRPPYVTVDLSFGHLSLVPNHDITKCNQVDHLPKLPSSAGSISGHPRNVLLYKIKAEKQPVKLQMYYPYLNISSDSVWVMHGKLDLWRSAKQETILHDGKYKFLAAVD